MVSAYLEVTLTNLSLLYGDQFALTLNRTKLKSLFCDQIALTFIRPIWSYFD